jgi:putative glycosyltransferase (TIGR04372 family)
MNDINPLKVVAFRMIGLLGAFILIVFDALRPFVDIRLGLLHVHRVGHLIANTEYWLRKNPDKLESKVVLRFIADSRSCNHYLIKMMQRRLPVIETRIGSVILDAAQRTYPGSPTLLNMDSVGGFDFEAWESPNPNLIQFTEAEIEEGYQFLERLNIGRTDPYVCFAVRDQAYLESRHKSPDNMSRWSYHDYRDSELSSYYPAINWLTEKGYKIFRMGAVTSQGLSLENDRVIDYSKNHRSEFLDIFLVAHCSFFLGDTSGIYRLAATFGPPIALANQAPLSYSFVGNGQRNSMSIPKKVYSTTEGRILQFSEVAELGADLYTQSSEFEAKGLKLIDNSSDEILDLVNDMHETAVKGRALTPTEVDLNQRFLDQFPPGHPILGMHDHISYRFVKRNESLFS